MVAGGNDGGQPDGGDFTKGQVAGPVAVGGKVLVQQGTRPACVGVGLEEREVIDPFDPEVFEEAVDHAESRSRGARSCWRRVP